MGYIADFFVASDAQAGQLGLLGTNPYDVAIFQLPARPSLSTRALREDQVHALLGQLAGWDMPRVDAHFLRKLENQDLVIVCVDRPLVEALAVGEASEAAAAALMATDAWGDKEGNWDDIEFVQQGLVELRGLAAEALRTGSRLWWWHADSELFK